MRTVDVSASAASPIRRIDRARCIELGEILTIDEARRAFLGDRSIEQFHFECAEPACSALGVRIAGVNYRFDAEERPKLVSNHYRRLDDHQLNCPYYAPAGAADEGKVHRYGRLARALRRDLVEEFVPRSRPSTLATVAPPAETPLAERPRRAHRRVRKERVASTSSLSRLIDTYRTVVNSKLPNAVRERKLYVRGHGSVSLAEYVTPVYRALQTDYVHVIYGGARWVKSYGSGFKLRFIDRLKDEAVFVYVPSAVAFNCVSAWQEAISIVRAGGYCTAYVLGPLRFCEAAKSYSVEIEHPDDLVLRVPPGSDKPVPL